MARCYPLYYCCISALIAAVVSSVGLMCKELRKVHEISKATVRHREQLGENQGKFQMRKMKACTLSEIKEGLASLTGAPRAPCPCHRRCIESIDVSNLR